MSDLKCPTQLELDRMSHAEKDEFIRVLFARLEVVEKRLKEMEDQIKKTSRNSSKPPSSDGLKRLPAQPRERGKRPNGGQLGHPGVTRTWTETPDEVKELWPSGQGGCGLPLEGQAGVVHECRQQLEIPEPKIEVTEYRQMTVVCACGGEHRGEFPAGVTPHVSYGPRLKAYAVGLVEGHFVSVSRTTEVIADQSGVQPLEGSVQTWIGQAAKALSPAYEATREALVAAEVVHFDESGLRVQGQLQWLHVAGTADLACYTVHPKRGVAAMTAAGVLPRFKGQAVHDHWKPYFRFEQATHSLCNAHILRELRYFEETTAGHRWPVRLREILVAGKKGVAAAKAEVAPRWRPPCGRPY